MNYLKKMKDDEVFDPYDVSNYMNPTNQKASENNIEGEDSQEKPETKNVFNPYEEKNEEEDKLDQNDEYTKLKQKKQQKNKRKKTDEGLSENIDLSKNAYEDNDTKEESTEKKIIKMMKMKKKNYLYWKNWA